MTNKEYIDILNKIVDIADQTQYGTGAFGAVCGLYNNRERYAANSKPETAEKIMAAPDGTFLFDCIGFAEAPLWGFSFDKTKRYGGANYEANGVPTMPIKKLEYHCSKWTSDGCKDPNAIMVGEILRTKNKDHVAVYKGNGRINECTQKGKCRVREESLDSRTWDGHGMIKYIEYHDREKGDVNGDGKIDAKDYMLCKRIVLKTYEPTDEELWAADINGDGKVSALDYLRLKRMVLKK